MYTRITERLDAKNLPFSRKSFDVIDTYNSQEFHEPRFDMRGSSDVADELRDIQRQLLSKYDVGSHKRYPQSICS